MGEVVGGSWRTGILKVKWPRIAPVETSLSMIICLIGKERREGGRGERKKGGKVGREEGRKGRRD